MLLGVFSIQVLCPNYTYRLKNICAGAKIDAYHDSDPKAAHFVINKQGYMMGKNMPSRQYY